MKQNLLSYQLRERDTFQATNNLISEAHNVQINVERRRRNNLGKHSGY